MYVPATHDASGHHTNGVESGDEIGSRWGEVEGQNNGQLEEHGIIDRRGAKEAEERNKKKVGWI
jgi:hypothetical protein